MVHRLASRTAALGAAAALTFPLAGWAAAASPPGNRSSNGKASELASLTVETLGPVRVGEPLPTFAGIDLDNRSVSLRSLLAPTRDRPAGPLVVSVFATWCESCELNLPVLARLQSARPERNVKVVLVAFGHRPEDVKGWLAERRLSLPAVADPFEKISERLGVKTEKVATLPRTFVLDSTGVVRAIFVHEGADFEQALSRVLDSLG